MISWARRLVSRFCGLFRQRKAESEFEGEMRIHHDWVGINLPRCRAVQDTARSRWIIGRGEYEAVGENHYFDAFKGKIS